MTKAPLTPPVSESDDPEYATNLRRATLASTVGSALEYDDFALYGLASALIFSQLFFTNVDPAVGLVASFATSGVPGWWLISLGQSWLVIVVIALGIGFGVNAMLGPHCAMLPELFGNRHRYLGVAITREFSAVIAGGLAGVLGAILIAAFDGSWVPLGVYMFVLAAITFGTTFIAPETQGRDLLQVEDALDDVRAVDDVRAEELVSR